MDLNIEPANAAVNRRLAARKQPEPVRGGEATLLGIFHQHPCTVVSVNDRELIIQEDRVLVVHDEVQVSRDLRGKLWFFVRRKGSSRWRMSDGAVGLNVLIGEKRYSEMVAV